MSQRYFNVETSERKNNGGGRLQTQRFSPQKTSRSINFPRSSSEDNFVDFVPLDNSSPVQVGSRGGHWRMHNNLGHNSSFSPYSSNRNQKFVSHNRSFSYNNKSQRYSPQNNRGGHHNNYRGSNNDLRSWYDPSMVEDPWAALEKKQEQRQQNTDGVNNHSIPRLGNNLSPKEDNKNSNSASSFYHSMLNDPWAESVKSKELHPDVSCSPRSTDSTDVKELSPSLSEKSVGLHTPRFVSPT